MLGLTPPYAHHWLVGQPTNFFIHDGYKIRTDPAVFNDTGNTDEYQLPVYKYAREVADQLGCDQIFDVGCGSGFKLVTRFHNFLTVGIDLPDTIHHVRTLYPDRKWFVPEDDINRWIAPSKKRLVICADTVEHVQNPNQLFSYIALLGPESVIFSTPDRNSLLNGTYDGPPHNPSHVREWSMCEFHAYLASWWKVLDHFNCGGCQIARCLG